MINSSQRYAEAQESVMIRNFCHLPPDQPLAMFLRKDGIADQGALLAFPPVQTMCHAGVEYVETKFCTMPSTSGYNVS